MNAFTQQDRERLCALSLSLDEIADHPTLDVEIADLLKEKAQALHELAHSSDGAESLDDYTLTERECDRCGDLTLTLSSRDWCDGCEAGE
jgi:hypothetical protein